MMMTIEIGFVLFVIALMMLALIFEITRPEIIIFFTVSLFMLTGILTVEETLKGFSNEGMLTIALLFIVVLAIQKSGIVDRLVVKLLGNVTSERWALFKIIIPVGGISGFLNNTPIVVMLTPIIRKWCAENNISPSKFLIPLSYATILGGTLTLIGTSTNLIVHGLLLDLRMEGFSFFQIGYITFPAVIIGLIYIISFGYRILPNHKLGTEIIEEQSREYLSEMIVEKEFPFLNQTVEEASLRNLKGLFLIEIIREDEKIIPVKSSTLIKKNDRLIFTGLISTIAELEQISGLRLETGSELTLNTLKNGQAELVEAVVSHHSSLLFKKIKDTKFRSLFDAGVIAVHRNNERIISKVGDITLKAGDTLLLLSGSDFHEKAKKTNDFYITTSLRTPSLLEDQRKGWFSVIALFIMIFLVVFNIISMFKAMIIVVILLFIRKVITLDDAMKSIQFNILLLIASAIGIGTALLNSGAAFYIANGLVSAVQPFGILAIVGALYLITNLITEFVTNNATAVIMFPIAIEVSLQMNVDPMPLILAVTIAASAGFATPIGYQTNLIVYGPGGYNFKDYFKVGIPLNIIIMISTIIMIAIIWL